ncbi:MAG: Hsp20/alpha crystallin family protein [Candidatus Eiseniibacteriota bacterium]
MLLTRINSGRDLLGFDGEVNRIFSDFLGHPVRTGTTASAWIPAVDVHEDEDGYTVRVDLPGVNPKDVKVQMLGETLTIQGQRNETREENKERTHRLERVTGSFERSFRLRARVDGAKVKASYKDGVLEIRVPKLEEAKSRDIAIEVA